MITANRAAARLAKRSHRSLQNAVASNSVGAPSRQDRRHAPPSITAAAARRSLSAVAAADDAGAPASSNAVPSPHNIYMWGTTSSKKATIPTELLREASAASPSASGGGMFGAADETILDHPVRLNLESGALGKFLFGEEGGDGDNGASLDRVYCGASGTALVLSDGRCFVVGSNKNGELG